MEVLELGVCSSWDAKKGCLGLVDWICQFILFQILSLFSLFDFLFCSFGEGGIGFDAMWFLYVPNDDNVNS